MFIFTSEILFLSLFNKNTARLIEHTCHLNIPLSSTLTTTMVFDAVWVYCSCGLSGDSPSWHFRRESRKWWGCGLIPRDSLFSFDIRWDWRSVHKPLYISVVDNLTVYHSMPLFSFRMNGCCIVMHPCHWLFRGLSGVGQYGTGLHLLWRKRVDVMKTTEQKVFG